MKEFVAPPIGLIINHYSIVITAGEGEDEERSAIQHARFIEVAFCLVDKDTDGEFYSLANTYSMN